MVFDWWHPECTATFFFDCHIVEIDRLNRDVSV